MEGEKEEDLIFGFLVLALCLQQQQQQQSSNTEKRERERGGIDRMEAVFFFNRY